jgi:hypothetical protein
MQDSLSHNRNAWPPCLTSDQIRSYQTTSSVHTVIPKEASTITDSEQEEKNVPSDCTSWSVRCDDSITHACIEIK